MEDDKPTLFGRTLRLLGATRFDPTVIAEGMGAKVVHGPNWSYAIAFASRAEAESFAFRARSRGVRAAVSDPIGQTNDVLFLRPGRRR